MTNEILQFAAKQLLHYAGGSLQVTNLNKALFYLDLQWLLDRGETFTGARYVALRQGPVVDDYKDRLVTPLVDSGDVRQDELPVPGGYVSKPLTVLSSAVRLDDEHLELVMRRVAENAGSQRAVDLSEYSHENIGWKLAYGKGEGSCINMMLALEQLLDNGDDDWLGEELTEHEQKTISSRLAGEFVPF